MSTLHRLKRALFYPRVLIGRLRYRGLDRASRAMLEAHAYSRHFLRFAGFYAASDPLHRFALDRQSVVLDLGGYDGAWAEEIYRRYRPRMHIYEPWPGGVRKLRARFANAESVTVHPYAVANRNGEAILRVDGPGSALTPNKPARPKEGHDVGIQLRDIAEIMQAMPGGVDLLKINIEGSEYEVLERMIESDLLRRCGTILVQFHEWEPGAYWRRWQIIRALRKTHRCLWSYPFVWECWERRTVDPGSPAATGVD